MSELPTINEIVRHVEGLSEEQVLHLTTALVAREDNMADMFRLAGIQFGLYPWIMAEVFAEVGIGTPVSDEARGLIRQQFTSGMEELRRQMGQ